MNTLTTSLVNIPIDTSCYKIALAVPLFLVSVVAVSWIIYSSHYAIHIIQSDNLFFKEHLKDYFLLLSCYLIFAESGDAITGSNNGGCFCPAGQGFHDSIHGYCTLLCRGKAIQHCRCIGTKSVVVHYTSCKWKNINYWGFCGKWHYDDINL